jgi:hypothetical protein
LTDPFPLPLLPVVIVSQPESLDPVQSHPVPAVTPTDPVVADAVPDLDVVDRVYEHGGGGVVGKVNWFDTALALSPPGPTATTRAS